MKHAFVLGSVALLVAAIGCAPDLVPPTTSCTSVADCEIGKVCDQPTHQCIAEAPDRFLGRFHCKVSSAEVTDLQLSEVVGHASDTRYALTNTTCFFDPDLQAAVIFLADDDSGETMQIRLNAGLVGRIALGPAIETGAEDRPPFVLVYNGRRFTREGTSVDGFMTLSTAIADGADLEAYLDVTMTSPPRHLDAVLGEPCENGLADCGTAQADVGGARTCIRAPENPASVPMCTRACTANGDCSLGKGICNNGLCTRRCATDADCSDLGRACTAPASAEESSGCQDFAP